MKRGPAALPLKRLLPALGKALLPSLTPECGQRRYLVGMQLRVPRPPTLSVSSSLSGVLCVCGGIPGRTG